MLAPVASALDLAHVSGLVHQALGDGHAAAGGRRPRAARLVRALRDGRGDEWWGVGRLGRPSLPAAGAARGVAARAAAATSTRWQRSSCTRSRASRPTPASRRRSTSAHLSEPPPRLSARVPELGQAVDAVVRAGAGEAAGARRPRLRHCAASSSSPARLRRTALPGQRRSRRVAARTTAPADAGLAGAVRAPARERLSLVAVASQPSAAARSPLAARALRRRRRRPSRSVDPPRCAWKQLDSQRWTCAPSLPPPARRRSRRSSRAGSRAPTTRPAARPGPARRPRAARAVSDAYAGLLAAARGRAEGRLRAGVAGR